MNWNCTSYLFVSASVRHRTYINQTSPDTVDATLRLQTGYTGSQGHKSNSVDRVLEEDEAAQVAGNIADECSAECDHADGQDEGAVAAVEP